MKANKKTLMAVKRYLEEPEGYYMDEVISDLVYETMLLKVPSMGDTLLSPDECDIVFDGETVCNLDDFVQAFSEKFIRNMCNVLDSFVGDDIDCYLEDDF